MQLLSKKDLEQVSGGLLFEALAIGNLALTLWYIDKSYNVMHGLFQLTIYQEAQLAKLPHYEEMRNDPNLKINS